KVIITMAPKGFGSENMSRVFMLKPADGIEGVKNAIITAVKDAGPNACPPMVVGVGIGGSFDYAAVLAKKASLRDCMLENPDPDYAQLERELLEEANQLNIGPQGLGGKTSVLKINIEQAPTHIAGLPVAVNISCHVTRHISEVIE
uniref:fumarate hydratase n=1 Tax=Traorella massiliensis TaxID=1903263 RepID=UPI00248D6E50